MSDNKILLKCNDTAGILTFYIDHTYRFDHWEEDDENAEWKLMDGCLLVLHKSQTEWHECSDPESMEQAEALRLALEEREFYKSVDEKLETE